MTDGTGHSPGSGGGEAGTSAWRRLLWPGLLLAVVLLGFGIYERWRIELEIESVPAGAVLRIDGQGIGLTPLTVPLSPGRHRLELSHSHFVAHEETVDVHRGDRLHRQVVMRSGTGRLSLLSNPRGAWVEVDGERIDGVTPVEVAHATGPASIRMGLSERRAAEKEVIVLADQTLEVNLELNIDPHGSLTVAVSPGDARVRFPELEIRYQPGVRIPLGEQLIEVSRTGYETQQIRFDVRYGDNFTRVTLGRALGALNVSAQPADARITLTYERDPGRFETVPYQPGMRLPVGRVEVNARAIGYRTAFRAVDLTTAGRTLNLTLRKMDVRPGERFADELASGGQGPLMVVIPPGEFVMGDPDGPPSVQPARLRILSQAYALSVHEVSVAEYLRFTAATGQKTDERLVTPEEPARYVSWKDAVAYSEWLTRETGAKYRLPTEAEWEYAARAGSNSDYYFGDASADLCGHANLADLSTKKVYRDWDVVACDDGYARLAPVGSYAANPFGLHDVHGNVTEWVAECGMPEYDRAPEDGARVITGQSCRTHGVRGGSWDSQPEALRSTRRGYGEGAGDDRGIRLLREL